MLTLLLLLPWLLLGVRGTARGGVRAGGGTAASPASPTSASARSSLKETHINFLRLPPNTAVPLAASTSTLPPVYLYKPLPVGHPAPTPTPPPCPPSRRPPPRRPPPGHRPKAPMRGQGPGQGKRPQAPPGGRPPWPWSATKGPAGPAFHQHQHQHVHLGPPIHLRVKVLSPVTKRPRTPVVLQKVHLHHHHHHVHRLPLLPVPVPVPVPVPAPPSATHIVVRHYGWRRQRRHAATTPAAGSRSRRWPASERCASSRRDLSKTITPRDMAHWPKDVGILAIEAIYPAQYVDQEDLERFDNVSPGKYTKGLSQGKMGFVTDREDINSLCLTVTSNLLRRYNVDKSTIGRLEVGTETLIDKSKSVKTVLMKLFEEEGYTDMEGVDSKNACYGGTAALFNSLNWVESSAWDGRNALVVAGDIAVYPRGGARPTGGAGAVAILVGPNAPLVIDRKVRSSHMQHSYDFYKPNPLSEYPTVDGPLSVKCYLSALDKCYQRYCAKAEKELGIKHMSVDQLDAFIFHAPYGKLVRKSLARVVLNDFVRLRPEEAVSKYPPLEKFVGVKLEETYADAQVEKAAIASSEGVFAAKTAKSLRISNQVGNMYTPSVYGGLISHLLSRTPTELAGTRIGMFSFGSGLTASMFSIKFADKGTPGTALHKLCSQLAFVNPMLERRLCVPPEEYNKVMEARERDYKLVPFQPSASIADLLPGTYYLTHVDDQHRRFYDSVPC